jgi:adenylate kinase
MKQVILITGTPCTGKTTAAMQLTQKLDAEYINLTDYAKTNRLTKCEDKARKTTIINEEKMRTKLAATIKTSQKATVIIDAHYAAAVTPTELVTKVFVLRKNPKELKLQMEALQNQQDKVCEIDTSGKTTEAIVDEIMEVLTEGKQCRVGLVDWLGMLEREGLTDLYLKA